MADTASAFFSAFVRQAELQRLLPDLPARGLQPGLDAGHLRAAAGRQQQYHRLTADRVESS